MSSCWIIQPLLRKEECLKAVRTCILSVLLCAVGITNVLKQTGICLPLTGESSVCGTVWSRLGPHRWCSFLYITLHGYEKHSDKTGFFLIPTQILSIFIHAHKHHSQLLMKTGRDVMNDTDDVSRSSCRLSANEKFHSGS